MKIEVKSITSESENALIRMSQFRVGKIYQNYLLSSIAKISAPSIKAR